MHGQITRTDRGRGWYGRLLVERVKALLQQGVCRKSRSTVKWRRSTNKMLPGRNTDTIQQHETPCSIWLRKSLRILVFGCLESLWIAKVERLCVLLVRFGFYGLCKFEPTYHLYNVLAGVCRSSGVYMDHRRSPALLRSIVMSVTLSALCFDTYTRRPGLHCVIIVLTDYGPTAG